MKTGFTLIEFIIAFMFSAIIISVIFASFFQINHTSLVAQDIIDINTRVAILNNQLERDINGIFVPIQAQPPAQEQGENTKKEAEEAKKKTEQEKKQKPLQNAFYSINKQDMLSELTFISNDPIAIYEYAQNIPSKPKMVRIVYRLVADEEHKGAFKLLRQEGIELEFAAYKPSVPKPIKAYELVNNIKKITISFKVPKEPQKDQKSQQKKESIELETMSEWKEDKKTKAMIPLFVEFDIVLWDNQQEREYPVKFAYSIPSFFANDTHYYTSNTSQSPKPALPSGQVSLKTTPTLTARRNKTFQEAINELFNSLKENSA